MSDIITINVNGYFEESAPLQRSSTRYQIEECVVSAYNQIKDRKGKMTNGTFVKEQPQTQNGILPKYNAGPNPYNQTL